MLIISSNDLDVYKISYNAHISNVMHKTDSLYGIVLKTAKNTEFIVKTISEYESCFEEV